MGYVPRTAYCPTVAVRQSVRELPLRTISSILGILLVIVSSSPLPGSGSICESTRSLQAARSNAPVSQRVFWVIFEGMVAAALLAGRRAWSALQAARSRPACPYAIVPLAGLLNALNPRHDKRTSLDRVDPSGN